MVKLTWSRNDQFFRGYFEPFYQKKNVCGQNSSFLGFMKIHFYWKKAVFTSYETFFVCTSLGLKWYRNHLEKICTFGQCWTVYGPILDEIIIFCGSALFCHFLQGFFRQNQFRSILGYFGPYKDHFWRKIIFFCGHTLFYPEIRCFFVWSNFVYNSTGITWEKFVILDNVGL